MALSDSLLYSVQGFVTPDLIKKGSGLLGQSSETTQAGARAAIPTLLMGLAHRGSTQEGSQCLMNMIQEDEYDKGVPTNYLDHFKGGKATDSYLSKGSDAVRGIFGEHLGSVTDKLGSSTGLPHAGVTKLLGMFAPIVLGTLGSRVKQHGMNASGLSSFLGQQRSSFEGLAPKGIFPSPVREVREAEVTSINRPTYERPVYERDREEDINRGERPVRQGGSWLPLALAILLALCGFWLLRAHRRAHIARNEMVTNEQQAGRLPQPTQPVQPQPTQQMQQPGVSQNENAPPANTKDEFGRFLESGSNADLPKRFAFNDLKFESGSAELVPESHATINRIASDLRANPNAEATVESYTDNVGEADANLKLSQARSNTVEHALVARGVEADRVRAVGKGAANPVAPNATEDGRSENRHTEIVITQR